MILPVIVLIFSRDRAMQLEAVLRSFFLHCQDCQQANFFVLYRATSPLHVRQYEVLKDAHPGVNFVEQGDFRRDVLRIVNPYPRGSLSKMFFSVLDFLTSTVVFLERRLWRIFQSILMRLRVNILGTLLPALPETGHILFLVDDNLFVGDFSLAGITQKLQQHPEALGFSLRLGRNITHCYPVDRPQFLPQFLSLGTGILKFDWGAAELDFAYPLEVSSSVYRVGDIFPIIAKQPFENPNELEYRLSIAAGAFAAKKPFLLCPERSYTFCNPANVVQTTSPNRVGLNAEYTGERLAELFGRGFRIRVNAYDGFIPRSCHQEVLLEFYTL